METLGFAWPFEDIEAEAFLRGGAGGLVALITAVGEDQGGPRELKTAVRNSATNGAG